jgi:hypothetical protein
MTPCRYGRSAGVKSTFFSRFPPLDILIGNENTDASGGFVRVHLVRNGVAIRRLAAGANRTARAMMKGPLVASVCLLAVACRSNQGEPPASGGASGSAGADTGSGGAAGADASVGDASAGSGGISGTGGSAGTDGGMGTDGGLGDGESGTHGGLGDGGMGTDGGLGDGGMGTDGALGDGAVDGDAGRDGDAGCNFGCRVEGQGAFCTPPTVTWVCSGPFDRDVFRDGGCQVAPSGLIRYCCPPDFMTQCP